MKKYQMFIQGSASFWLFQKEVCKLIGKSPGYLISKAKKDLDNTSYPEDLNVMLNKHYALKVQVSSYNLENNYHIFTTNKIPDDEDVIKSVIAKSKIDKEKPHICEEQKTHSEVGNIDQQQQQPICDDENNSEVREKRKRNVEETRKTKAAKTTED